MVLMFQLLVFAHTRVHKTTAYAQNAGTSVPATFLGDDMVDGRVLSRAGTMLVKVVVGNYIRHKYSGK